MNSASQILTPVANQLIESITPMFIEGIFTIVNMSEEDFKREANISRRDPYSFDQIIVNDIFKALIKALPSIRTSVEYQRYVGVIFSKFIRKGNYFISFQYEKLKEFSFI